MDFWQLVYFGLLSLATIAALWGRGRQAVPLAAVMWLNFVVTFTFAPTFANVMIVDLLCATAITWLYSQSKRELFVAFLFGCMVPIYILAIYGEWTRATTYTIIDVIAYAQLLTMGWPIGLGIGKRDRRAGGLGPILGALSSRLASSRRVEGDSRFFWRNRP